MTAPLDLTAIEACCAAVKSGSRPESAAHDLATVHVPALLAELRRLQAPPEGLTDASWLAESTVSGYLDWRERAAMEAKVLEAIAARDAEHAPIHAAKDAEIDRLQRLTVGSELALIAEGKLATERAARESAEAHLEELRQILGAVGQETARGVAHRVRVLLDCERAARERAERERDEWELRYRKRHAQTIEALDNGDHFADERDATARKLADAQAEAERLRAILGPPVPPSPLACLATGCDEARFGALDWCRAHAPRCHCGEVITRREGMWCGACMTRKVLSPEPARPVCAHPEVATMGRERCGFCGEVVPTRALDKCAGCGVERRLHDAAPPHEYPVTECEGFREPAHPAVEELPTPEQIADRLVADGQIHRYDDEEARRGARAAYTAAAEYAKRQADEADDIGFTLLSRALRALAAVFAKLGGGS